MHYAMSVYPKRAVSTFSGFSFRFISSYLIYHNALFSY